MKKNTILIVGGIGIACLISFNAFTFGNGAPQGRSGSPLSNGVTCAASGCHTSGPAVTNQIITITNDIPSTGFLENTNYNFTITLDDGGATSSKVGFSASIEDQFGMVGSIIPGGGSKTVGNFLTHTGSSTSKPGQTKDYDFVWNSGTAAVGTQIYVAANFSNSSNSVAGDVIVSESLALLKGSGVSLAENETPKFQMAPNPAVNFVTISDMDPNVFEIEIYAIDGKLMKTFTDDSRETASEWKLNLSEFKAGNYLVVPRGISFSKAQKLIIGN